MNKPVFILILIAALLFGGCMPKGGTNVATPQAYSPVDFAPEESATQRMQQRDPSSLWFADNGSNWLFTDQKARAVNDVVTIQIVEESSAKSKAETKTQRGSSLGAGITGLFGLERQAAKGNPDMNLETLLGGKLDSKFNGKGETTRTGKLVATVSAVVIDVLPNGNLVIRGKRSVKVNNEEEVIVLTGIVRPKDISAENTILSTQIAEAKIEYIGRGVVSDKQRPGWLNRGADKVWPF